MRVSCSSSSIVGGSLYDKERSKSRTARGLARDVQCAQLLSKFAKTAFSKGCLACSPKRAKFDSMLGQISIVVQNSNVLAASPTSANTGTLSMCPVLFEN